MNNHTAFVKRAKKLLQAGVKPVCFRISDQGDMINFHYAQADQLIGPGPCFFTDVEPPTTNSLMVANMSRDVFAPIIYELAETFKGPVRIAGMQNQVTGALDHWACQFANATDLNRALKEFRGLDRNHAISITFEPNQKDPS